MIGEKSRRECTAEITEEMRKRARVRRMITKDYPVLILSAPQEVSVSVEHRDGLTDMTCARGGLPVAHCHANSNRNTDGERER